MKLLYRIGLLSIPLTFLLAGSGMLWLLNVENTPGSFFEQLVVSKKDWLGAHIVLLLSTVFLLPAAISIRRAITHKIVGMVANFLVLVIVATGVLLAGQYAIDFVMPLLAEIGGEAHRVHGLLYATKVTNVLFYKLPSLVFLALFLLSCLLFWSKSTPRKIVVVLLINWLIVLLGNLVNPMFQRIAIIALAFSFVPFVKLYWNYEDRV
jgi:hypothetical protein